ncbi:efflux RND transporter permease subunit [Haloimpatiens massiliensis]|uniref:efflux RND transporter permease subunit n=1 Tax=Haloimpatiens massiliensis TaxID=1658110 RepID=UPI000C86174F|nr:MMPL family transporter [Haloimpatiens massiliensis]
MKKFGRFIAKNRILVVVISILLMFPALYGMISTRINYDLLTYLPQNLDSMKGQEILDKKYSDAATSMLIIEDMEPKDIVKIKEKVSKVEGVNKVIWVDDVLDTTIPKEILPDEARKSFYSGNSTMLIIKFNESPSSENTQQAITDIRKLTNKQCFLSGMSAIVKDTKDLADKETPFYVLLAVVFSVIVLSLTMKSVIIPFIFLLAIGIAILYNFGTNIFFGQISYVTKALAAVLQLGVTMDYSIFLLHRYDEEREKLDDKNEAMADAISNTIVSITGSSLTTIAGFLALCVMTLALGKDIGIVMAKGVVLGVISTVTVLPALILIFDKPIHRFSHKTILPEFDKVANLVTKKYKAFIALFLLLFIPAVYGNNHTKVYYNLDESLPKDMESIVATNKLKKEYNMTTTHFILVNDKLEGYKVKEMVDKLEKVDGIEKVLSYDKFIGSSIPESFIPKDIRDIFKQGGYNLILANSKYKAARDEENAQIDEVNKIVKSYDKGAMVAGEGPLTKDLIEIADKDFKHVSVVSIAAIFAIILIIFKSISIPILLVSAIELAIFINMGIPFYTGTTIPFIASIVIGCIQLGATVDYAILMTTRFREEIRNGYDRFEAGKITVKGTAKSIVTSGLTFFAATASVGIVSNMDLIKTLCGMIARGALISMGVILFILPSILIVCEKFINATTRGWKNTKETKLNEKIA